MIKLLFITIVKLIKMQPSYEDFMSSTEEIDFIPFMLLVFIHLILILT